MDSGSFAPTVQFEKREIHPVFRRFPNFHLLQNLSLSTLADLIIGYLTGRFKSKNKCRQKRLLFFTTTFSQKIHHGRSLLHARTACIMVLHSKTASLPNGHFLPFCYKQNFSYPEKPANCTNFLFSPTFACIRTLSCYNGLCRPLGEQILKGNQEKCLKNASSSPRTAPP